MTAGSQKSEVGGRRSTSEAISRKNLKAELDAIYRKFWNKVEERLPQDSQAVLLYCDRPEGPDIGLYDTREEVWVCVITEKFIDGVTHWMEIVPPEVES